MDKLLDPAACTLIYDTLAPRILEAVETQYVFRNFQKLISKFADRNADVLQTNIVGRQLLFSEDLQAQILTLYNVKKEDVLILIDPKKGKNDPTKTSQFFIELGGLSMNDQLCFLIPMSIIAGLYAAKKKDAT